METDFLLFQVEASQNEAPAIALAFTNFCDESALGLRVYRIASAIDNSQIYLYAKLPSQMEIDLASCHALQGLFHMACGQIPRIQNAPRVSRLQLALHPEAHSKAEVPQFHYVVETDTDEGWFDKIAQWYDEEHMLGLAAVPGTISAMRLINLDAKCEEGDNRPPSFACYDLTSPDVLGSAEWLAVRHTAWSDVARPHFKNTLRTMMAIIHP